MRRLGRTVLWGVAILCGGFLMIWALALWALADLDAAVARGDLDHPLAPPKAAALFLAAQVLPLRQPGGPVETPGRSFRDCPDCPELVEIPPGMFLLGSPWFEPGRYEHIWLRHPIRRELRHINREGPRRLARIAAPFAMMRHELTLGDWEKAQADPDWQRITGIAPRRTSRHDGATPDFAVTNVDQDDAHAYAAWLSAKTGQRYRLASEAEWEYAARAGTATVYPWGNEIGIDHAACLGCSTRWTARGVGPVGLHPANGFGLQDMIGNGWEWVEDCFVPWHDPVQAEGRPYRAEGCKFAVFKGGTAIAEPWQARSAMRVGPHSYNDGEGSTIRLVRELPGP